MIEEDINKKIGELVKEFILRNGIRPNTLYLGKNEMAEILNMTFKNTERAIAFLQEENGPTFNGLKVYEVYSDDHIAVHFNTIDQPVIQ